MEHD
jgi:NIMA (never in mitosis gene a)-related kinase 1/4/5